MKIGTVFLLALFQFNYLIVVAQGSEKVKYQNDYSSIVELKSSNFISISDASRILGKTAIVSDSSSRNTSGLLRCSYTYIVPYKDSTSKGRLFFTYEQYNEIEICKSIFQSLKKENEKSGSLVMLKSYGDEAFLIKDNLNFPFIVVQKNNKLFKFKLYYQTGKDALDKLLEKVQSVASLH